MAHFIDKRRHFRDKNRIKAHCRRKILAERDIFGGFVFFLGVGGSSGGFEADVWRRVELLNKRSAAEQEGSCSEQVGDPQSPLKK